MRNSGGVIPLPVAEVPCEVPWCTNNERCRGEHSTLHLSVAATGDAPEAADVQGATFPAVTVRGTWAPDVGVPLAVCLHIGSERQDAEVFLRPEEARHLIENIQLLLDQIGAPNA